MKQFEAPKRLFVINIDGLRQDVFHQALEAGQVPHLASLLGGPEAVYGCHLDPVSTAPSITFCAQSTIFTGAAPGKHGMVGNQWFDRFGVNGNQPRFYAFDIGDTLAVDDAVRTFTGKIGLVGSTLSQAAPTLYEYAADHGFSSSVTYHMVSRGASRWIKPKLADIARFTKGSGLVCISAERYDREMMDKTLADLKRGHFTGVQTVYFMGLDHQSHHYGPEVQQEHLTQVVDPQIGRLVQVLTARGMLQDTLVLVVSDHGQIRVIPDDRHSLRLSFPFDREMGYLFDALGLDVHDVPGEAPNCDAVVGSNGGMAHVYLQNRHGHWRDAPLFESEVLPVARAFWAAHAYGLYAPDFKDALSLVLVRNVEQDGWYASYEALSPEGQLMPVADYLAAHPEIVTVDAVPRLRQLAGPNSGDVLLVSNYRDGFYFGGTTVGVHGGLHPEDSLAVGTLAWVGASDEQRAYLREVVEGLVRDRRAAEGRAFASLTDLLPVITQLFGWGI